MKSKVTVNLGNTYLRDETFAATRPNEKYGQVTRLTAPQLVT